MANHRKCVLRCAVVMASVIQKSGTAHVQEDIMEKTVLATLVPMTALVMDHVMRQLDSVSVIQHTSG